MYFKQIMQIHETELVSVWPNVEIKQKLYNSSN